jgi:hypothetical protein
MTLRMTTRKGRGIDFPSIQFVYEVSGMPMNPAKSR